MNGSRLLTRQHDSAARGTSTREPRMDTGRTRVDSATLTFESTGGSRQAAVRPVKRSRGAKKRGARAAVDAAVRGMRAAPGGIRSGGAEEAAGHLPLAGGREAHLVLRWPLVRGRGGHGSRGIGLLPPLRGPPLPAPNAADAAAHAADVAPLRAGARTWDGRRVRHLPPKGRGARRYSSLVPAPSHTAALRCCMRGRVSKDPSGGAALWEYRSEFLFLVCTAARLGNVGKKRVREVDHVVNAINAKVRVSWIRITIILPGEAEICVCPLSPLLPSYRDHYC